MGEYIERERLLDKLNNIRTAYQSGYDFDAEEVMDRVIAMVKEEDVSDVRFERHGEWEIKEDGKIIRCSVCGQRIDWSYCPGCGAMMDRKDVYSNE